MNEVDNDVMLLVVESIGCANEDPRVDGMFDVIDAAVLTIVGLVSDGENPRVDGMVDVPVEDKDDDDGVVVDKGGMEVRMAALVADVVTA